MQSRVATMITYHQLRTFLTVVRTGNLTKAARELNARQPTVSLQLRALQKTLGTVLLERSGRGFRPTHTGEMLRRYAEETLSGFDILQQDIASLKGSLSGSLALGSTFVLDSVLPSVSSRFRVQFPSVVMHLHVDIPEELFERLLAGTMDVACYIHVRTPPGLTVEVVGEEEFVIVASPEHPLARQKHVSPAALSEQPLVVSRPGLFRESLAARLRALGIAPGAATEAKNFDAVTNLVAKNVGYSIHVKRKVINELAQGRLVVLKLDGPPILSDVVVAYRSRPVVPPLIRELLPFLRAEFTSNRVIAAPDPVGRATAAGNFRTARAGD